MRKNYYLILFLSFFSLNAFAQISVTVNSNAAQLAQIMSGPGVSISNVNFYGAPGSAGSFTCTSCSLGMDSGIVLTTGKVTNVTGPNAAGNIGYPWNLSGTGNGDPDLAAYINQPVTNLYDNCALEFDLVAQSDSVQFKYIFGSEEYPEFVCSPFNDAFAFFISGPGITGLQNIAIIPGTTVPVAINSINPGVPGPPAYSQGGTCSGAGQSLAYSQYYVNNGDGTQAPYNSSAYYIQYDGYTRTLTAAAGGLIPCQTYHLKLVIDDVTDATYDSGVFIQANSLSSNLVTFGVPGTTSLGVDSAIRGCVDGIATFKFIKPVSVTTTVNYTTGGTAVNGTDYTALNGSVQFAPGDSAKQVVIHGIGGAAQTQSVVLYLSNSCSPIPYDSTTLYISPPQQTTANNDTSICQGDSVRLRATGAAGTTYAWSPNTSINNANISNPYVNPAATTTYTCTATLAGCTSTASVVVTIYTTPPFSVNAGPDVLACGGGTVQLDAIVSGNPIPGNPFTYSWLPATGLTNSSIINPVDTSSSSTTYTVYVKSGRCTASDAVVVTLENVTETLSSTLASCSYSATGTATAAATSGTAPFGYSWSSGAATATASNLASGLYTVTVSDQVGCTSSDTITVYAPPAISFGVPTISDVSCPGGNNGTASITATGGTGTIGFAWSSGSNTATASNLTASTYTVTATDGNACTGTTTVTVGTLPPVVVSTSTTNVSCFGGADGTATATVTGGTSPYTYLWSTGGTTATITGLIMGSYPVTATDNAGCTASAGSNVAQQSLLTSTEVASNVLCFGGSSGSIIISPSGGTTPYGYLWQDGSTQQNRVNIPIGTYTLIITDAKGCNTYDTAVLTQPTALVLTDSIVNATCYGTANGAIYLTVSGGSPPYSYDWGIGVFSQNLTNIPADNYYPSVTDNQGCVATALATVTSPGKIQMASMVTDATCFGKSDGTVQVTTTGGTGAFTYTWNGVAASNPDNNLAAGTYAVIATDANNCTAVDTIIVAQPALLTLTINGQNALCFNGPDGQAIDMPAGGTSPYTYNWSNGQTGKVATALLASSYQSTVTDQFGCTASSSVLISQPAQILFNIDSTAVKCIGSKDGTITVNVTSGGVPPYNYAVTKDLSTFIYQTGPTIVGLDTGKYIVIIADSNGCEIGSHSIVPNAIPDSFNIVTDSTSCFGAQYADGAIHVTGLVSQNTPYQYKIDNSPFQFSGDFYNLASGSHTIEVSNYNQCLTDTSATIGEPIEGFAQVLPKDTTMPLGEKIQLFSSFTNYPPSAIVSYNWVPSVGLSCTDCPNPVVSSYTHINNYKLTITYNNGCLASDSARVIVVGTPQVFVPNSFSPNGDGNNDLFLIYGEKIKTVNLKVFNRWGELVFNSENQFLGWDGNYKGQQQQTGVYVYEAQVTFLDNTQTLRTGSITLIR